MSCRIVRWKLLKMTVQLKWQTLLSRQIQVVVDGVAFEAGEAE